MITMDLREAIQLQSVYGPSTGAYALVADLGQARDSVLAFLCAPLPCVYCTTSIGPHDAVIGGNGEVMCAHADCEQEAKESR